ncbi:MAG: hypothetical protein M3421_10805 [Bacteroidota bacterium]|nr:hypothetical protein [Bacteroidota bacterium]
MTNILSLSCSNGAHSHLIPLFVLNQRYFRRMTNINNNFLLPQKLHKQYEEAEISVLPIDFALLDGSEPNGTIQEDAGKVKETQYRQFVNKVDSALKMSNADIVIDSNEALSTIIAEKNKIPRISIHRTGLFRSIDKNLRNPAHIHSMEKTNYGKGFDAYLILNPKKKLSKLYSKYLRTTYLKDDVDYFMRYLDAKTKLIPGIPSIEILPDDIKNKDSYFYTGPLLIEDKPSQKLSQELSTFFEINKNKKTVFISTGLIDQDDIQEMVLYLLKEKYAVISSRKLINSNDYKDQIYQNPFLSLNYICAKVNLVIHHCGSGMYHYPLLHQKPVITIGTQCYDREDVALRLQQLKLSRHVPSFRDDENYMEIFTDCVQAFEKGELSDFEQLKKIKIEINQTMLDFDMDEVIDYTLKSSI